MLGYVKFKSKSVSPNENNSLSASRFVLSLMSGLCFPDGASNIFVRATLLAEHFFYVISKKVMKIYVQASISRFF